MSSTPTATPSPTPADTATQTTTSESTEEDEAAKKAAKAARKAAKKAAKAAAREQEEREAKQNADQQETSTTVTETAESTADDDAAARKAAKKAAKRAAKEAAKTAAAATTTTGSSDEPMEEETKEPPRVIYKHDASKKTTETEVTAYRTKHQMQVDHDIKPIAAFSQLEGNIPKNLLKWLSSTYQTPTPIQAQCWPALLSGYDVVGIAETGSGKTLGFVVPAIVHIMAQPAITPQSRGPIVLILSPTRELAMQTADVCEKAGSQCSLSSICIYGGVDKYQQIGMLKKGVHFIVATPGRLLALINEKHCTLARVTYLILDEADRMLDMGFEPDIRAILAHISTDRQTLMFSATWPDQIQKLAHEFITNPVHITIGKPNNELTTNARITQTVEVIDDFARDKRLIELLNQYHKSRKNRVLIFVLYKKEVPRLERLLQQRGFAVRGISGDKNQSDRTQALSEFKSGQQPLLIATDVAARGLDIPNVEYVINYSFPLTIEDYVHRIGRTGRGGATGVSHTFFTKNDKHLSGEFINLLNEAKVTVPPELLKFGTGVKRKEHSMYGAHFKPDDDRPMKKATRIVF